MQMNDNTILITGGGSGIGRAMAEAFLAQGNRVIIAGRRQAALDEVTSANPGMVGMTLDVADAGSVATFAARINQDHPDLNVLIHMAGIMAPEKIASGDLDVAEQTVAINLLGPIRLTAALMPALLARPRATIMTVSSGLAFVPLAATPTYCATKAAIHSWSQSLRYQLRDTSVEVIELAPPYVQTELMGAWQASDENAMPLRDFVAEAMGLLASQPEAAEILVGPVMAQRKAEASGGYDAFFRQYNDRLSAAFG